MKTLLYTTLAIGAFWLSGCTGSRLANSGEFDDVYATSEDYQADAEAYTTIDDAQTARQNGSSSASDQYDAGYASKNAERRGEYMEDPDPYGEDDFYYSRRIRRFNTRGFNYYDPYFAYDPYYVIGTPTWGYYNNSPWWYDPYYYNGPSFSWTYSWGAPGYAFYPSYYSWNRPWWDRPYYGGGYGWGYSSYGFGYSSYYGGGYGGYYGSYWSGGYNPYCPPGGFGYYNNGGGWNSGWGGGYAGNTTTTTYGPRGNMSSLNANSGANAAPYHNPRAVRPYQGNYPLNSSVTNVQNASGNSVSGRPTGAPVNNSGNVGATPRTNTAGRPVNGSTSGSTYSTPRNSNTYTRPSTGTNTGRDYTRPSTTTPREVTPSNNTVTPRSTTPSRNYTQPTRDNNNSGGGRNYTQPSRGNNSSSGGGRNYNSRPSRSSGSSSGSFSSPSRSSGGNSGGSFSSPSRSSSSGSTGSSSSGGGRRR